MRAGGDGRRGWRYAAGAVAAISVTSGMLACGGGASPRDFASDGDDPESRSYLSEERCQPVDDMNDPSDGVVPSPEELLPDPELCPEFYEGNPEAPGVAPPPSTTPPVSPGPSPGDSDTTPYDPCAEGESLNGNPCVPVGDYPTYPSPDPPNPSYPVDPPPSQPDY